MTTLEAALALAERGFHVVPCQWITADGICSCKEGAECPSPAKHPRTKHGLKNATTDPILLKSWWARMPQANLALVTGAISGVDCIDIDPKNGGVASLDAWESEHGKLPDTPREWSGSRGRHFIFRHAEGMVNSAGKIAPGIDVRGDGGYVLIAPSIHESGGQYRWIKGKSLLDIEPAEWPEALRLAAMGDPKPTRPPLDHQPIPVTTIAPWIENMVSSGATEGQRNNEGIKVACRLVEEVGDQTTARSLFQRWGRACNPPLKDKELDTIWGSACKKTAYGPKYVTSGTLRLVHKDTGEVITSHIDGEGDIPVHVEQEVAKLSPFPIDALLSPILIRWVKETAATLDADYDYPACAALATLSGAIGMSKNIRLAGEWRETAALWIVLAGEPGTAKTPSLTKASSPLWAAQKEALRNHAADVLEYGHALEEWERQPKTNRPSKPKEPLADRFWMADTTIEKLADTLSHNERGVIIVRDELAGWIGSFGQYKSGSGGGAADKGHWLSIWANSPTIIDRKTNNYTAAIDKPYAAVLGCITPNDLTEILGEKNDGFTDRLLFCYPPTRTMRWTTSQVNADTKDNYALLVRALLDEKMADVGLVGGAIGESTKEPNTLLMSPEAEARFGVLYDLIGKEMDANTRFRGVYQKLRSYAGRITAVLQAVRCVENPDQHKATQIDVVEAAWRITDYFKSHALRAHGLTGYTKKDEQIDAVFVWIQKRKEPVTYRDIMRGHAGGIKSKSEAEIAVTSMVDRELLEAVRITKDGKELTAFQIRLEKEKKAA